MLLVSQYPLFPYSLVIKPQFSFSDVIIYTPKKGLYLSTSLAVRCDHKLSSGRWNGSRNVMWDFLEVLLLSREGAIFPPPNRFLEMWE